MENRFSRQILVLGVTNQAKLSRAKILIVGVGGLGCPAALYLVQSGIGEITLIDPDTIELTNLHRQILYTEKDISKYKVDVAARELKIRNSSIQLNTITAEISQENIDNLVRTADVVLDCTDNYKTRYLLNSSTRLHKTPLVSASIYIDDGHISTFNLDGGPCLECLFPSPPPISMIPNCSENGVLGIDTGILGTMQAKEVLNIILGQAQLNGSIMSIKLNNFDIKVRNFSQTCHCASKTNNGQNTDKQVASIDYKTLCQFLSQNKTTQLLDVRSNNDHARKNIGGSNIPLNQLPDNYKTLKPNYPVIVYCQKGKTSITAADFLIRKGFKTVLNLRGGIDKVPINDIFVNQ